MVGDTVDSHHEQLEKQEQSETVSWICLYSFRGFKYPVPHFKILLLSLRLHEGLLSRSLDLPRL